MRLPCATVIFIIPQPCPYAQVPLCASVSQSEFLALKHKSGILGHSFNPACGFFIMEHSWICAVRPTENWLGSSLNQIQGWTTVQESYSRAFGARIPAVSPPWPFKLPPSMLATSLPPPRRRFGRQIQMLSAPFLAPA